MRRFYTMILACLMGGTACTQSPAKFISQNNIDFAGTVADTAVQIVDVRTPAEFASGHIPNAVNVDVNGINFDKQISALDKKRPVAVYCRSGARSKHAARKLSRMGFKVYELDRGVMNWNGEIVK